MQLVFIVFVVWVNSDSHLEPERPAYDDSSVVKILVSSNVFNVFVMIKNK